MLTFNSFSLAPSVFGSIADRKGRRPIFLLCILILSLSNVGLALVPTKAYWLLVVLRILQATGSASTIALGAYMRLYITQNEADE